MYIASNDQSTFEQIPPPMSGERRRTRWKSCRIFALCEPSVPRLNAGESRTNPQRVFPKFASSFSLAYETTCTTFRLGLAISISIRVRSMLAFQCQDSHRELPYTRESPGQLLLSTTRPAKMPAALRSCLPVVVFVAECSW